MNDLPDAKRLDLIARAFRDCEPHVSVEEVTEQFRYETLRYPTTAEVEAAIKRNAK